MARNLTWDVLVICLTRRAESAACRRPWHYCQQSVVAHQIAPSTGRSTFPNDRSSCIRARLRQSQNRRVKGRPYYRSARRTRRLLESEATPGRAESRQGERLRVRCERRDRRNPSRGKLARREGGRAAFQREVELQHGEKNHLRRAAVRRVQRAASAVQRTP